MLPPSKWGKYFWSCLHLSALGFPEVPTIEDRANYAAFYADFGKVLPCPKCKGNYARHFQELPVELFLFGRSQLFDWTVKFHNIVNKELGKPEWTYEQAWNWYTKGLYGSTDKKVDKTCDYNMILLILNIMLLVVLTFVFSFKYFIGKK